MRGLTPQSKGLILVTGAAGRIGQKVIKQLEGYDIVGFEKSHLAYTSEREEVIPCDLSNKESVALAFQHIENFYGKDIVAVIHLAAYYSFTDTSMDKYKKITVGGTINLLNELQRFNVGQFFFSSTMLLQKPCKLGEKINEESPIDENCWAYPMSKILTEAAIKEHAKEIPTLVMRISGVYVSETCQSIPISNQLQRVFENQFAAHVYAGDVQCGADFMEMSDLVDAICAGVEKRNELPKNLTLIMGEGDTLSYDEIQRIASKEIHGKEFRTYRLPKCLAWFGIFMQVYILRMKLFIRPWMVWIADQNFELDISLAEKLLNWKPKKRLRNELIAMIDRLKKNPRKFYKENGLNTKYLDKRNIND